jgi:hypothetical protein
VTPARMLDLLGVVKLGEPLTVSSGCHDGVQVVPGLTSSNSPTRSATSRRVRHTVGLPCVPYILWSDVDAAAVELPQVQYGDHE